MTLPTLSKASARAFTLIELLVVIAIIGILASVVLASLNSARTKGKDASVKSDVDTIATQAALYNSDNGTYGTAVGNCTAGLYSDATVQSALSGISQNNGGAANTCYAGGDTYAVAVQRPADSSFTPDSVYWCADSTGRKCGINDVSALSSTGLCGCP